MRKAFRAKRIDNGEWIVGDLVWIDEFPVIFTDNKIGWTLNIGESNTITFDNYEVPVVDKKTIGMFSGLKDRNGKEIFNGDILHVCEYQNDFIGESMEFREAFDISELKGKFLEEYTDEVVFNEGCFSVKDTCLFALFGDQRHSNPIFEFEVIGNIYDNPELLKRE